MKQQKHIINKIKYTFTFYVKKKFKYKYYSVHEREKFLSYLCFF